MKNEDEKSRGFGFVCFKDWEDAQKVIDEFGSSSSGKNSSENSGDE